MLTLDKCSFADFMDFALYDPEFGYYTSKKNVLGSSGDFYTSAHVGKILGGVLAEVFSKEVASKNLTYILEYGAGDGKLAAAFLEYLAVNYPSTYAKVSYYIVEISDNMKSLQLRNLENHRQKVTWISHIRDIKTFSGMIFGNEFLDALPVHVLKYYKDCVKEMFVQFKDKKVIKSFEPLSEDVLAFIDYLPKLPSGAITEFCPRALEWLREIDNHTEQCSIYMIDYGYSLTQKNTPQRLKRSSIRCFKQHKIYNNPFAEIGKRDITADVDFTTLSLFAENLGMAVEKLHTQSRFIMQSGYVERMMEGKNNFTNNDVDSEIRHLKQMIFPGAMGEVFNVLNIIKV